jgi:hypothetical protein
MLRGGGQLHDRLIYSGLIMGYIYLFITTPFKVKILQVMVMWNRDEKNFITLF